MAKSNPLFVDSTKFHGDRIGTQIELTNVMVFDDEILLVKITDHDGEDHHIAMQPLDERTFVARVWLSHQKKISYQFVIEKHGVCLFSSVSREARAQYAIIEEWEPAVESAPPEGEAASEVKPPLPDTPWTGDYASTVESLIEKWGL